MKLQVQFWNTSQLIYIFTKVGNTVSQIKHLNIDQAHSPYHRALPPNPSQEFDPTYLMKNSHKPYHHNTALQHSYAVYDL